MLPFQKACLFELAPVLLDFFCKLHTLLLLHTCYVVKVVHTSILVKVVRQTKLISYCCFFAIIRIFSSFKPEGQKNTYLKSFSRTFIQLIAQLKCLCSAYSAMYGAQMRTPREQNSTTKCCVKPIILTFDLTIV